MSNIIDGIFVYDTSLREFLPSRLVFNETIESVTRSQAKGEKRYLVPGLIDSHMHIESSMTSPYFFAREALKKGTTTILSDCHEISNVFGVKGLEDFMAIESDMDIFYAIPSSVPASSLDLETSGAAFDEAEVRRLAKNKKIIALGEVMNALDLFSDDDNRTKRIIKAFKEERPECPIEGHCPRLSGMDLQRFAQAGISSDHTEQTPETIRERLSAGLFLQLQYKSLSKENIDVLKNPCYMGHWAFCTDDVMPDVFVNEGHLDRVVRKAIELGMRVEDAIYAATYAPAVHMRLFDRGMIAPSRLADFIILDDLSSFSISEVWKNGKRVYKKGLDEDVFHHPGIESYVLSSIKRNEVKKEDFSFKADGLSDIVTIKHKEHTTMTEKGKLNINFSKPLPEGVNIIASVERYGNNAPIVPAILENGFTRPAAIASSWAHDSHNILVLATDAELASRAVNEVIRMQGGIVALDYDEKVSVPLPYAGIVSLEPLPILAEEISEIRAFMREHGWKADEEIMSYAVLALPVSPAVKITDKGLVDVKEGKVIDIRIKE